MRKEVKNYYETNFGSFSNISAAAIEAECSKESRLTDLPVCISFTNKTRRFSERATRKHLHDSIKKAFKNSQN